MQVEVAQVYERELQDDEAAVEGYRQALEFDPANPQALASLEQLYSKLDRPAELLAVYERQIELTTDYRERVKILFRSAAIWEERYQNLANADACIEAALQVDPQNIQAIKTLERLRKSQGRWDELIGVVDRHISLLTSPAEKAELCVEMGDIFHQQLKAVDRAVTAYHQAIELDPRCRPAMHALGMLYERSGNWPFALDMLEREAQVLGQTPEAVELWYRMGKINEDMLIDAGSAKRCYLEALRIDAAYLPAIRALKGIYELERDFESYEKALIEEAQADRGAAGPQQGLRRRRPVLREQGRPRPGHRLLRGRAQAAARLAGGGAAAGRHLPLDRALRSLRADARHRHRAALAAVPGHPRRPRAGPRAVPAAVPPGLRVGEERQARQGAGVPTSGPTSSTPPTCRCWRATATCWCRPSGWRRRSGSTSRSWCTTAAI